MKFLKGLSTVALSAIMMFSVASANVFAASTTQDGLEVSLITDKETYTKDEKITATLSVKNTNSTEITDVTMETVVPNGYGVIDGSATTKHIEKLAPNETVELKSVYNAKSIGEVSEVSEVSKVTEISEVSKNTNNNAIDGNAPLTGDNDKALYISLIYSTSLDGIEPVTVFCIELRASKLISEALAKN